MQHHKYSLTELENMMPWEREIYVSMLLNYLQEEKDRMKKQEIIMAVEKPLTKKVKIDLEIDTDTVNS